MSGPQPNPTYQHRGATIPENQTFDQALRDGFNEEMKIWNDVAFDKNESVKYLQKRLKVEITESAALKEKIQGLNAAKTELENEVQETLDMRNAPSTELKAQYKNLKDKVYLKDRERSALKEQIEVTKQDIQKLKEGIKHHESNKPAFNSYSATMEWIRNRR